MRIQTAFPGQMVNVHKEMKQRLMMTGFLGIDNLNVIDFGKNQQVFACPSELLSIIMLDSCMKTTAYNDTLKAD